MYKCGNCGKAFDNCGTVSESRGEFWGVTCSENIDVCPYCESDEIYEAIQCPKCGEWIIEDETDSHFCKECEEEIKEEYESDTEKLYNLCKLSDKVPVEMNSLLACVYEPEEIEEILLSNLKGNERKCEEFIEDDTDYFFDLVERKLEEKYND